MHRRVGLSLGPGSDGRPYVRGAAPLDEVRVVKRDVGLAEPGPPQEFRQVLVAVSDSRFLPAHGDLPPAVGGGRVDDDR